MTDRWIKLNQKIKNTRWDYQPFEGCIPFNKKLRPSDIDGALSFDGKVMFFEFIREKPLSLGQLILYKDLLRIGKGSIFLCLCQYTGPNEFPVEIDFYKHHSELDKKPQFMFCEDQDFFNHMIGLWFQPEAPKGMYFEGNFLRRSGT